MSLRYALTRLARPEARRVFGRTWLWICLAGAALTLAADGGRDFFLVLVVWLVCVFAPVRIAVETLHSRAPRLRETLQRRLMGRPDRYTSREDTTLMIEWFAARDVQAPRLAPPDLVPKIVEAAARLCRETRLTAHPGHAAELQPLRNALTRCASLLHEWVGAISRDAAPPGLWDPSASIQEQWGTLRAVAALAALTKVLVAVYEDSSGRALEYGAPIRTQADAAMDYVDQVGLRLDGPVWDDVAGLPRGALSPTETSQIAETWRAFCSVPLPAPRRLAAFTDAVLA